LILHPQKEIGLNSEDESSLSEISILPDGRVYLFGASRQVLELLQAIPLGDPALAERIEGLRAVAGLKENCLAQNDGSSETLREDITP
jgi:hypothetical protein